MSRSCQDADGPPPPGPEPDDARSLLLALQTWATDGGQNVDILTDDGPAENERLGRAPLRTTLGSQS